MSRHRLVRGEMVPFTDEEELERDEEEAAAALNRIDLDKKRYLKDRIESFSKDFGEDDTFNESVYLLLRALVAAVKEEDNIELNKIDAQLTAIDAKHPKP
tara:strand:+ start:1052 stop:1351 length:300 start_codon:yes stop_codon:yes gene_type:complete